MDKPWNVEMKVSADKKIVSEFKKWYEILIKGEKRLSKRKIDENPCPNVLKRYIEKKYHKEEYGLKMLARVFGLTYTKMRTLFKHIGIDMREGNSVVTSRVKKFRSERVTGLKNPWSDAECRKNVHSNGIQGYYTRPSGEKIWLRSCWEYIYAKWLDRNKINYEYELRQYVLSNGESYRPDFFILTDDDDIMFITEVKGFNKEKLYKVRMLEEEYGVDVVLIEDIKKYCKSYEQELNNWKLEIQK